MSDEQKISKQESEMLNETDRGFWTLFRLMGLIAFITFLTIPYIYNAHRAENKIRHQEKLKKRNEELRSEYITLKSEVIGEHKQSDVARKLEPRGLKELSEAPIDLNEPAE